MKRRKRRGRRVGRVDRNMVWIEVELERVVSVDSVEIVSEN